jgi:SAM-dependent methyltransferase
VGTGCLAAAFGSASVVAADSSPAMLDRALARAERAGLSDRIEARRVELPAGLSALGPAEVAWASLVVHHVGDEAAALRSIADVLVPGGVLALVELAGPVRVAPDDLEWRRPGAWARLEAAWAVWFDDMRGGLPGARPSTGYPDLLAAAGLELLVDEVLADTIGPPLDATARRFGAEQIAQTRTELADIADLGDLDALQSLVDDGVLDGEHAVLQASRRLYIARRQ